MERISLFGGLTALLVSAGAGYAQEISPPGPAIPPPRPFVLQPVPPIPQPVPPVTQPAQEVPQPVQEFAQPMQESKPVQEVPQPVQGLPQPDWPGQAAPPSLPVPVTASRLSRYRASLRRISREAPRRLGSERHRYRR